MESDYKKYKKEQAYKRKKFLELAKRIEDNIIVTNEELNKAILIIKRYCKQQKDCNFCKFNCYCSNQHDEVDEPEFWNEIK